MNYWGWLWSMRSAKSRVQFEHHAEFGGRGSFAEALDKEKMLAVRSSIEIMPGTVVIGGEQCPGVAGRETGTGLYRNSH